MHIISPFFYRLEAFDEKFPDILAFFVIAAAVILIAALAAFFFINRLSANFEFTNITKMQI